MCDISREDWQLWCKMPRATFLQLLSPDLGVRARPLLYASSFLKPSTYCSKILTFKHECAAIPALSSKHSILQLFSMRFRTRPSYLHMFEPLSTRFRNGRGGGCSPALKKLH